MRIVADDGLRVVNCWISVEDTAIGRDRNGLCLLILKKRDLVVILLFADEQ